MELFVLAGAGAGADMVFSKIEENSKKLSLCASEEAKWVSDLRPTATDDVTSPNPLFISDSCLSYPTVWPIVVEKALRYFEDNNRLYDTHHVLQEGHFVLKTGVQK